MDLLDAFLFAGGALVALTCLARMLNAYRERRLIELGRQLDRARATQQAAAKAAQVEQAAAKLAEKSEEIERYQETRREAA